MLEYKPFVQKLKFNKIINEKFDTIKSYYHNEPLFSLGYHYYLKQVRQKLNSDDLLKRIFYLIVNNFEINIPDYENDLENKLKKKLKIDNFYSRDFLKIWEIFSFFNIVDEKSLKSLCLSENGGFIQGIYYFREYYFNNKNDKLSYEFKNKKEDFQIKSNKFNKMDKNNPIEIFNTSNSLLTVLDINKFIKNNKLSNLDLITSNGSDKGETFSYKYLVSNLLLVIKLQNKGGKFILRLGDIYTSFTVKIINILHDCYKEVYLFKPLFSREYTNEKYLICINFNLGDKDKTNLITKLEKLLDEFSKNKFVITDFITSKTYDSDELKDVINLNNFLSNKEHNNINKIIEYRNKKNYFGEEYHSYKENQIKNSDYWYDTFIKKNYKDLTKL